MVWCMVREHRCALILTVLAFCKTCTFSRVWLEDLIPTGLHSVISASEKELCRDRLLPQSKASNSKEGPKKPRGGDGVISFELKAGEESSDDRSNSSLNLVGFLITFRPLPPSLSDLKLFARMSAFSSASFQFTINKTRKGSTWSQ